MTVEEANGIWIGAHFQKRFRERTGSSVDPIIFGRGVMWAIHNDRADLVQYKGRLRGEGARLFEAQTTDGRWVGVVANPECKKVITAYGAGMTVACGRNRHVEIGAAK